MTCYIGIDSGLTGAVALVDNTGKLVAILDIPIMAKNKATGKVKNYINAKQLWQDMKEVMSVKNQDMEVYLETVNSMPGQGVSSVFSLGDTFGSIRAVCACLGLKTTFIAPAKWKKHYGISSDKEVARALAINMFPNMAELFKRKKDHNRAEAALIARYGWEINK